ncbi:L,D-transpeptidase family protein [Paenibacillus kobensis]|uniref:L,D-transpeptidase family protein n=1 Tax=Paenibacillus kobensis TaxID=59841 RepID=UPI000FD72AE2|nr:L,D-transpeptidase [Paenibacillus kobensis]
MEPIRHSEHLKQYVKRHPDNQMGWYLLGKYYEEQGKLAKANYCFIQAGDIFEAFEQRRDPLSEAQEQVRAQAEHAMEWLRHARKRRLLFRWGAIAAVLLLLSLLLPLRHDKQEEAAPSHTRPLDAAAVGVVYVDSTENTDLGAAMVKLTADEKRAALGIAAKLAPLDSWRNWNGATELLFAVEQTTQGGVMEMNWYESRLCDCTPADAAESYEAYERWSQEQEQRWTLSSAIRQYNNRTDKWPASMADLVQPYPNNTLSGDTPLMQAMFAQLLAQMQDAASASGSGEKATGGGKSGSSAQGGEKASSQKPASSSGTSSGLSADPLRIIVDKSAHRLAVLSGNVIVRSYKVGLGGDRTPKGTFYISEKVKNPNGRDDGPFGSRGMTLSDTRYAIHGTDEPLSVGADESLGCVRMSREDIEELFDLVPLGTKVTIQQGGLPDAVSVPESRFRLDPKQDETNPLRTYAWLD